MQEFKQKNNYNFFIFYFFISLLNKIVNITFSSFIEQFLFRFKTN